jgi:hypothetical protein
MVQTEFVIFKTFFNSVMTKIRRQPSPTTAMDYTLRLSATLRVYNLSHSVHDVMCAVVKLQAETGHATIPAICVRLACTYQAVMQHFLKNPDIFIRDESHKPARYTLSDEGIRLLNKVKTRVSKV